MTLPTAESLVLTGLFQMAQQDRAATVIRLCAVTELQRGQVEACLGRLDAAGLVDRERLRLTLPGLALAVAVAPGARRQESRRTLAA